jgi:ABC-type cobalamin/Fe3+-siderophores transport system ATPase subunit
MNAITCDDLTRAFGTVRAVDGVSFAVPAGRIFTLLGANGAGKTTTICTGLFFLLVPGPAAIRVLMPEMAAWADQMRNTPPSALASRAVPCGILTIADVVVLAIAWSLFRRERMIDVR